MIPFRLTPEFPHMIIDEHGTTRSAIYLMYFRDGQITDTIWYTNVIDCTMMHDAIKDAERGRISFVNPMVYEDAEEGITHYLSFTGYFVISDHDVLPSGYAAVYGATREPLKCGLEPSLN